MSFRKFIPSELSHSQRHHYILGSVNPRPICFASTVDKEGRPNLAPYSFFNVFSSSPPVFIFSVNTRRDGSLKDTFINARHTKEVVINIVNFSIAHQMAIAGVEFDTGINEFEKSGLTPLKSEMVAPFRVKESPVQYECKVLETRSLSDKPGAANLIIAEALCIHIDQNVFTEEDHIDPNKINTVGRLGNNNYCKAFGEGLFSIVQPPSNIVPGFDALPIWLRNSKNMSAYELSKLAGAITVPTEMELMNFKEGSRGRKLAKELSQKKISERNLFLTEKIKESLDEDDVKNAWEIILCFP